MKLWDVAKRSEIRTLYGQKAAVYSVCFSPDGKHLAVGFNNGTSRVGSRQRQRAALGKAHERKSIRSIYDESGHRLATASADGTIKISMPRMAKSCRASKGHDGSVYTIAFCNGGRSWFLRRRSHGAPVGLSRAAKSCSSGKATRTKSSPSPRMPPREQIASGSQDRTIRVWK